MKALITGSVVGVMLALTCVSVHCQTLTNADLNKPHTPRLTPAEAAAILTPHQYVAPPTCTRCDGPYVGTATAQPKNMSGPWDWPEPTPLRRLDGTLLDYPPTVYGVVPYWPSYRSHQSHAHPRRR